MKIAKDKILHFSIGAVTSFITYMSVLKLTDNSINAATFSIVASYGVGLWKELYDEWKYKGFSFLDLLATILGGLCMTILLYLFI